MRLWTMVGKELRERPVPMATCGLAIVLSVTALVAVRTVTVFSERAVARDLDALGANVLVLPRGVTLQDYYAADMHGETLPEEYVERLTLSGLEGVDDLSPRLCVSVLVAGQSVTLTGILPRSEFQAKAAWGGAGIFARPAGCGAEADLPIGQANDPVVLARKRIIEELAEHDALIGAEAAARAAVNEGDAIELLGEKFTIRAILPCTGTVDDARIFAHLHTVQRLAGKGEVVNAIEVIGCCKQIAAGLVEKIAAVLPEARVVTIAQVVKTQQNINRTMGNLSLAFLALLLAVGGAATAGAMYGNVSERRREVGTLMALGATPGVVLRLFLGKALVLGLLGGLGGGLLGSVVAIWLGPVLANVVVRPLPSLVACAVGVAVAMALVASLWPAWRAARLDPCVCFQEV
ncbi:MAG TPA: FtsX-like permease family protein [Gemmataceae bacterium]|nr:FtsX-like permease family protein [Gemmataceae bacterium]